MIAAEADHAYQDLATNPQCGAPDATGVSSGYMQLQNKPLIVLYLEPAAKAALTDPSNPNYDAASYNSITSRFTIRWHQGGVENDPPSALPAQWQDYYGWVFWDGALSNSKAMVVMPGWDRPAPGAFVARTVVQDGQTRQFYDACAWQRAMVAQPDVVVINSYNEYAEQTAVAPTTPPAGMGWPSHSYYWDQTVYYNSIRKAPPGVNDMWRPGDGSVCNHSH